MTREEQIKEYCASQGFPYGACSGISNVCANVATDAIKWADKTMIERVRKLLYTIDFDSQSFRACDETFDNDLFIDAICKVMKE